MSNGVRYWVFGSVNIDNIRVAYERLLWGFWDRDSGYKQRKNWRPFIRKYNSIKPFDIAVFQVTRTYDIHAIGIIKHTYYDDQTPIWEREHELRRVLYPWRVSLAFMIFSKEPVTKMPVKIQDYIDGYGLGEIGAHDFEHILQRFRDRFGHIRL